MRTDTKRQNFNTTPEQEAELIQLRDLLDAPSVKDAILRAARVIALLARETGQGQAVYVKSAGGEMTRLLIPELEPVLRERWTYLVARPHPWRRQLYVKGRRMLASTVWADMRANSMSVEEAADNWDLPVEAVQEIVRYCEAERVLLRMEAEEEEKRLPEAPEAKGHPHATVAG